MGKFARVYSRTVLGLNSPRIKIEVHISSGLPGFSIVGLPETAVRESKDRVRSAIINSKYEFPVGRITVNLSPADIPKEGTRFDLPIAIAILLASQQIALCEDVSIEQLEFYAELSLSAELHSVNSIIPSLIVASKEDKISIIASGNAEEAKIFNNLKAITCSHLIHVIEVMRNINEIPLVEFKPIDLNPQQFFQEDMSDIIAQNLAMRALEISACGHHNLLMVGPPGSGKTMLAKRLKTILPLLNQEQAIEVASIYSLRNTRNLENFKQIDYYFPPFRSPHHTSSEVALVGGGSNPKPGEISLAHRGILFLDELPEFKRTVLESLREPIESGIIHLSRASTQVNYPADFILVAALNPTPQGDWEDKNLSHSELNQIQKYRQKISQPLLDRIDLHVDVPKVDTSEILKKSLEKQTTVEKSSEQIRNKVIEVRKRQLTLRGVLNYKLSLNQISEWCALDSTSQVIFQKTIEQRDLSARSVHKVLKVARTIADMEFQDKIKLKHLSEALCFKSLTDKW